jgi:hypothetical protein
VCRNAGKTTGEDQEVQHTSARDNIWRYDDIAESIGWEGTHIGRIWQFMREINIKIKGPNTKQSRGDNFTTTANTKDR